MNQAIVAGATGFIGSKLVERLLASDVKVFAIARDPQKYALYTNRRVSYIYADLLGAPLNDMMDLFSQHNLSNATFYNLSWHSSSTLISGSLEDQIKNVAISSLLVKLASSLGCSKYIDSGSQLESLLLYNENINSETFVFDDPHKSYILAKLFAHDIALLESYLNKIDYIHTRFSVAVEPDFSGPGYISDTIRRIIAGQQYYPPLSDLPYDLVSVNQIVEAYCMIGQNGKNKANYLLSAHFPVTLSSLFGAIKEKSPAVISYQHTSLFDDKTFDKEFSYSFGSPIASLIHLKN